MDGARILEIARAEQDRGLSILAGLRRCPLELSRATTTLGAFCVDRRTGAAEIRISKYLEDETQVTETIRHELAHQAAWERYSYLGHGQLWRNLAAYIGCEPKPCAQFSIDHGRQRYAITCQSCGWTTTRQKRSKLVTKPWRFACSTCGGTLLVAPIVPAEPPKRSRSRPSVQTPRGRR